jgi:hypothetical protein
MKRSLEAEPQVAAQRASVTRARVLVPMAVGAVVEAVAIAAAALVGLSAVGIVLLAIGIAVVGAVIERQTVASLVAGAGIRVARPYAAGEQVRLFVPSLSSVEDAEVVRVGAANTTLLTSRGLVVVSNSRMLRGSPDGQRQSDQSAARLR